MSKTNHTIEIPDEEVAIQSHTGYGMRYPNGEVSWGSDNGISFKLLAEEVIGAKTQWVSLVARRAEGANINPVKYLEQHQLIKRTITVAITAPEEV